MNSRRSWMIVPAHQAEATALVAEWKPDVAVLDLEYTVPPRAKEAARAGVAEMVRKLADSQVDVFVRIERDTRWADVTAAVTRGIAGIVFANPDGVDEVSDLDEWILKAETQNGVEPGSTQLALMLESAKGFWDAAAIAAASTRVCALGVGRIDLTMQLGPVPQDEFRLFRFLMSRTVVAARMHAKQPLGAHWRPGSRGGVATTDATVQAAREARRMGFSGCVCAKPEQVPAVNECFSESSV